MGEFMNCVYCKEERTQRREVKKMTHFSPKSRSESYFIQNIFTWLVKLHKADDEEKTKRRLKGEEFLASSV